MLPELHSYAPPQTKKKKALLSYNLVSYGRFLGGGVGHLLNDMKNYNVRLVIYFFILTFGRAGKRTDSGQA